MKPWDGFPLIPRDRSVLRRIVGARALINPLTDRYLYPWRRLGSMIGADHKAVQRWHAVGIDMIVSARTGQPAARLPDPWAVGSSRPLRE